MSPVFTSLLVWVLGTSRFCPCLSQAQHPRLCCFWKNIRAVPIKNSTEKKQTIATIFICIILYIKWRSVSAFIRRNHQGVYKILANLELNNFSLGGLYSSVSKATRYGLDGPGIEFRWRRDFPHPSRPALGPTQPPVQWVPGISRG